MASAHLAIGWAFWAATRGAGCYAGLLMLIMFAQRSFIFPRPSARALLDPTKTGGQLIALKQSAAVHFPARANEPTIVFFHGNGDQIGGTAAHLGSWVNSADGLGFLGVEYPGYGIAPGSPSEEACVAAALEMVEHLVAPRANGGLGVTRESVILFGQSIGCALALHLAERGFGERLILLSPFTSLHDMAGHLFPVVRPALSRLPFVLRDKFDNRAKAKFVRIPTLVIHGLSDELVPFSQGRELAGKIEGAIFAPYQMGHNNVFSAPHGTQVLASIRVFAQGAGR